MNKTNLVPLAHQRTRHRQRAMQRWIMICGGYTVILAAASALTYFVLAVAAVDDADIARAKNENSHARTTVVVLNSQARDARRLMQSIKEVSDQPDWSILLATVGQRCGDQVFLAGCDISNGMKTGGGKIIADGSPMVLHLSGAGLSAEAIADFVLRLQEIPVIDRVKLLQTSRQTVEGREALGFLIDCSLVGAAGGPR